MPPFRGIFCSLRFGGKESVILVRDVGEARQKSGRGRRMIPQMDIQGAGTAPAQVSAARGFQANLKAGWNGLLIEVGRAVKVTSSSRITDVSLNVQR